MTFPHSQPNPRLCQLYWASLVLSTLYIGVPRCFALLAVQNFGILCGTQSEMKM